MTNLEFNDFWNVDHPFARLVQFLFTHAKHGDVLFADDLAQLRLGYLCANCDKAQTIRLMDIKKLQTGVLRDFFQEIHATRMNKQSLQDYLVQYQNILAIMDKIDQLHFLA